MAVAWIVVILPIAMLLAGTIRLRETIMPITPPELAERAAVIGIVLAGYSAIYVIVFGPTTSPFLGLGQVGLSVLLDIVSATFLLLMSFLAWVILRFSSTHLQGEEGEGCFTFWACLVLAGIVFLVTSGNLVQFGLGWVTTTIGANQLLIFYPHRLGERSAACRRTVFARTADIALAVGLLLLYAAYGEADITSINEAARAGIVPAVAVLAAACLAIAAVLQSALLPVHGWLVDAIETPTPASALLHAGVVSVGGFLLIRFADVMLGAPIILAILVIVGGFSALVGSDVMLTQSPVKTALAWSTVSQMGFIVLLCGLGLFPLALLHIIAHALYKTYAFLTAAKASRLTRSGRQLDPLAHPSDRDVAQAMGVAIIIYALVVLPLGLVEKSPQAVALGAILVFGTGYLVAQGLADATPRALCVAVARASVMFAASYFGLQWIAQKMTAWTFPPTPQAGPLEWMLIALTLLSFGAAAVLQVLLPRWSTHPVVRELRVHAVNGFYLNALTDRFVGAWKTDPRNEEI